MYAHYDWGVLTWLIRGEVYNETVDNYYTRNHDDQQNKCERKKRRDKKAILQMVCEDEIGEIGIEEK